MQSMSASSLRTWAPGSLVARALLVLAAAVATAVTATVAVGGGVVAAAIAAGVFVIVVKVGLERPRVGDHPLQGRIAHVGDLEPRRAGGARVLADLHGERRRDGRQVPDEDGEGLAAPEADLAELRAADGVFISIFRVCVSYYIRSIVLTVTVTLTLLGYMLKEG